MDDIEHVMFEIKTVKKITSTVIGKFLSLFKDLNAKHHTMEIKRISEDLYDQLLNIHPGRVFPVSRD
jgi:hypothetical protein